jgi:protein subunit release factor B
VHVAVLEPAAGAALPPVHDRDLDVQVKRGTGPGGQARNTTESAVTVRHRPSGIIQSVNSGRSQTENKDLAVRRVREQLAVRAAEASSAKVNDSRRGQAAEEVTFAWISQFDVVKALSGPAAGMKWPLRAFEQGRWGTVAAAAQ